MRYSWLSLVDLSRRKNPQHLRVALPLKPQRVVGKERVRDLGGGYWVRSSPFTLSPVPRLDTVQQMDRGGRGVTPSAIRGGTLLSDTTPAACQKRFINASRGGSARSPSVLRDPRQPGQSTAVAQKWGGGGAVAWRDGPLASSRGSCRGHPQLFCAALPFAPSLGSGALRAPTPPPEPPGHAGVTICWA